MQIKLEQTTNEGCWGSFFLGSSSYLAGRATAWREYRAFASFSLSFTTTTGIPPKRWMETEGDETGRAPGRGQGQPETGLTSLLACMICITIVRFRSADRPGRVDPRSMWCPQGTKQRQPLKEDMTSSFLSLAGAFWGSRSRVFRSFGGVAARFTR